MQKRSLQALVRELLERARGASGGRAAATVIGGHERVLRPAVIALVEGTALDDDENPGWASVHVLAGRVRLSTGEHSWEDRHGDLLVVPDSSGNLEALEDSAVLLTVASCSVRDFRRSVTRTTSLGDAGKFRFLRAGMFRVADHRR